MVRLLWVILSVGKVEFGVRMGGMAVVGGVLAGGLGFVVGGIVGISVEVTVGGIFSFGAMAVEGGNVAVGLLIDSYS